MKIIVVGLAFLGTLSTEVFASEVLSERARKFSCSNDKLVFQIPYMANGKPRSLWFTADAGEDGTVNNVYGNAEFAEGIWYLREDEKWESTVRFGKNLYVEVEAVCQDLGEGCTLKFSAVDEIAKDTWGKATCTETPYSPRFEKIEMEMTRDDVLGGKKFQGLLWDLEGFLQLSFDDYRIGDNARWEEYLIGVTDLKRYGSEIAFTMRATTHFGYCTSGPEQTCSSGQARWSDVNVLLSKNSTGVYEGSYYPDDKPSSEPAGKMTIRPL